MNQPTFFYNILKEGFHVVDKETIYSIDKQKPIDGALDFHGKIFGIQKSVKISLLENNLKEFLKKNTNGHHYGYLLKYKEFIEIVCSIINDQEIKINSSNGNILSTILHTPSFVYYGSFFGLNPKYNGKLRLNGRRYEIGDLEKISISELDKKYISIISASTNGNSDTEKSFFSKMSLFEKVNNYEFYDPRTRIGFHIKNDHEFYVFKKTEPFILLERINGKYYQFPEAKIGLLLARLTGKIDYGEKPVIINKYIHPSINILSLNKPYSIPCTGEYKISRNKELFKNNLKKQIMASISGVESCLKTGYFPSAGSANLRPPNVENYLTNPNYNRFIVKNPDMKLVTNLVG